MDGGEQPGRILDEAGEDELKARLVALGRDAEGLRVPPQSRLGLSNRNVQHRSETDTCASATAPHVACRRG